MNHAPPTAEGKASTQGPGALAGLKVIDLTRVLGGPYCTMVPDRISEIRSRIAALGFIVQKNA